MRDDNRERAVDRSLGVFFRSGVWVTLTRPRQAWQFARTVRWQRTAARARAEWRQQGVPVPPIIIFSVTHQCNLQCAGCYARSFHASGEKLDLGSVGSAALRGGPADVACATTGGNTLAEAAAVAGTALGRRDDAPDHGGPGPFGSPNSSPPDELSDAKLSSIVAEAADLGVSFFVIAGGEPLLRPEILSVAARFPRIIFLMFTNGILIDEEMVGRLAGLKNVVPLLSLEGTAAETDERRGEGTHEKLMGVMARLKGRRLFFGCSITLTSRNFSPVLDDEYIGELVGAGCRFFLFLDYTPTDERTEDWVLTDTQREQVSARMRSLRKRHSALFIAVPWDEQEVGGCLSSGRGFIHINASGDVEPCPFAPYSDVNLKDSSLVEALSSPFLAGLRALPDLSQYRGGGCALWKNREQVERVLEEVRSDRT